MQQENDSLFDEVTTMNDDDNDRKVNPAIYAGLATFVVLNMGMLLSLPPVLMGKGMFLLEPVFSSVPFRCW